MTRPQHAATIARAAWEADGRPDFDPSYEPTGVGRRHYDEWADIILTTATALGFELRKVDES
jgi:hypothetical protein